MSQLLQNAAYGAALILAVALLRRALGSRLVPEARLALWAVCLFRLLTPAAPESALSLWGPLSRWFGAVGPAPDAPSAPQLYVLPRGVPAPEPGIPWERLLSALWLAAGAALAARYVLSWRRTRRAVSCAIPLDRGDRRYAALPKCARLREGPMEGAPLTFGALRPTVVLSPGLDGAELDCVLAHEGVHASRRDNLWHYAMALATAVYWWNPAVWLMSRLLRRDIELSCDRAALRKLGTDRRAEYARALVSLATQTEGPAFCHTFGRKAAEERIRAIMKFKKTSVTGVVFTLCLVLAVTAAFASEPKTPPEEYDSEKVNSSVYVISSDDLNPDLPTYAEYEDIKGEINCDEGKAYFYSYSVSDGGAGVDVEVSCDGALDISSYKVELPDFDEDGNPVAEGTIGCQFFTYSINTGGVEDGLISVSLVEDVSPAGEISTRVYTYSLCDDEDCDIADPHAHVDGQVIQVEYENPYDDVEVGIIATGEAEFAAPSKDAPSGGARVERMADSYLENGYAVDENGYGIVSDKDGQPLMKARWGYLPCNLADCTVSGTHYHKNGEVVYF